ncbi:MAG: methyltransferase [Methylovirgula sp.]
MSANAPNPSHIMQIGMGFLASKTVLSAVELGVFATLGKGAMRGEDLRQRLQLHPRSAADFLDALVALGFLTREGDGAAAAYSNAPDAAAFLDPASPTYLGGILLMANRRLYRFWAGLTEALRTGEPQNESKGGDGDLFAKLYADPKALEEFMDAMAGVQLGNFAALAEKFDFSRYQTCCDVGGASGALSIAVARRHPNLRCISFDLPQVRPVAERKIAASGLDQIEFRAGNFMTDELPSADVVTMGNILHDWGTATKEMLIAKAYAALPVGGAFIAIENIIDDGRRENAFGLLMSLNMLIETKDGYDYTFAQFDGWCRKAGFEKTERIPLAGPASAAVAYK